VKGAKASGEDIAAFAREHITERAAAPKEVYVLDEMPLTDVQKPNKVKLRQDAARRAFTEALEPAIGKVAVDVGPDPTHGTLAVIRPAVSGDHAAVEKKVHEVMKAYAMKYEVRW
jgi:fatty-acyl-CoA synthase